MSDTVIKVENLGKKYLIRHQQNERYIALRDVLTNKFKSFGKRLINLQPYSSNLQPSREEFWALKDISFEVKQGDRLGIIGRNGAGKTTLLKLLSRITEPTAGRIAINGRVASLLEVGTGFHPELTGRENIYLNGAILGMNKAEIRKKFDEIVDFAEIAKFLDTPVKRYSSGMYVRLAFAVAAHLEPEILLVDEVLAVGDAAFQKKCLGKMEDVGKKGRTVLFVSHNMDAVMRLCKAVILLNKGILSTIGDAEKIINVYLDTGIGISMEKRWREEEAPQNENVVLLEVSVHDINKIKKNNYAVSEPVEITIKYRVKKGNKILQPAINLYNAKGINIFDSHDTNMEWRKAKKYPGFYESTVRIPGNFLSEGIVVIGAAILTPDPFFVHIHEKETIAFHICDEYHENSARGDYVGAFPGVVRPLLTWQTRALVDKIGV